LVKQQPVVDHLESRHVALPFRLRATTVPNILYQSVTPLSVVTAICYDHQEDFLNYDFETIDIVFVANGWRSVTNWFNEKTRRK